MDRKRVFAALCAATVFFGQAAAQDAPRDIGIAINTNGQPVLQLPLVPATESFTVLSSPTLSSEFSTNHQGQLYGYTWTGPQSGSASQFFQVELVPLNPDAVLGATVLNRLGYGPTPDALTQIAQTGAQAYIDEQLRPELIQESLTQDEVQTIPSGWEFVAVTGRASSSRIYISMNMAGTYYIDDLQVVAGSVPATGPNLLPQGDFEAPLNTNIWLFGNDYEKSAVSTNRAKSGNSSLMIVADAAGGSENSVNQVISPALVNNATYTISYWFYRDTNSPAQSIVRLSGSGIVAESGTDLPLATKLAYGYGTLADLQSWHTLHAVELKRQLLEVLLQFFDNHFVTQHEKSAVYFDEYYPLAVAERLASRLEYEELQRWRAALLKPDCTFYDLLEISAESPEMIIYLDTVNSKGNGSNIANENYARELLELFTFGVDNGYDQNDIVLTSHTWTGWSVNIVDIEQVDNPHANRTTRRIDGAPNGDIRNLRGLWTFNYKRANHYTAGVTIFGGKTVPARFGAPYAGHSYELIIPARTGTASIQDGYDVIQHLANQPFTQEYLSVKLCRLFIHDQFQHGVYDYTDPNLSAEGKLVRECMRAWENGSPKGQIRDVLRVIFNSELFRTQAASMQKVKTPFEYTVSAIRALRAAKGDGTFTASTDGRALQAPMQRMGDMDLFNRPEPDGWPESGPAWISSGTLAERLRFITALISNENGVKEGASPAANVVDPVALLKLKLPSNAWRDADAVARYFLSVLYPAEGKANLDLYRRAAIDFLNTDNTGVAPSSFATLADTSATYQTRVRGMVAMLMTFPRFQEQ